MSCKNCEENPIETYVRIGNGNVMIAGCSEHLRKLIDKLRNSKEEEECAKINLYIFDIDGVVADITHRLHYMHEKNYEKFYSDEELAKDDEITAGIDLVKRLGGPEDSAVVFMTGRPSSAVPATEMWFLDHGLSYAHNIFCRKDGDYRPSPVLKTEGVQQILDHASDLFDKELGNIYFIDDDPKNVQAVEEAYPEITGIVFTTKRMEK